MGIKEVLSAPRSPWQRAYMERVIGTIRRERLDHVIVLNEASLCRHGKSFLAYYHESRTHLSLAKDTPEPRSVHPPALGAVVTILKLADFTTATSAAQHESSGPRYRFNPGTAVLTLAFRFDKTPLFANRRADFSCFSIVLREDSPNI